jgi:hypothetical protein
MKNPQIRHKKTQHFIVGLLRCGRDSNLFNLILSDLI